MRIDDGILQAYLNGEPASVYGGHWIFSEAARGERLFDEPPTDRIGEAAANYAVIRRCVDGFTFRNADLVARIFGDTSAALGAATVLLTVGLPAPYDALALTHEGEPYVVIDLIRFSDHIASGHKAEDLINNFLSHELIHVLINAAYPQEDFGYTDYLDFIAFHEGFAHLLSYKENIAGYKPGDAYDERYAAAKARLMGALNETDPERMRRNMFEANGGTYWDKFASIASMLYMMRHIDELPGIFRQGWRGYTRRIAAYDWVKTQSNI